MRLASRFWIYLKLKCVNCKYSITYKNRLVVHIKANHVQLKLDVNIVVRTSRIVEIWMFTSKSTTYQAIAQRSRGDGVVHWREGDVEVVEILPDNSLKPNLTPKGTPDPSVQVVARQPWRPRTWSLTQGTTAGWTDDGGWPALDVETESISGMIWSVIWWGTST